MHARPLSLELNPAASISVNCNQQSPTFLVQAPIKGASFSSVEIDSENLPAAHAFLRVTLIDGCSNAQIDQQAAQELREVGLFVAADAIPQDVSYEFPQVSVGDRRPILTADELQAQGRHLSLPAAWADQALGFVAHHHGSLWQPVRIDAKATGSTSATKPVARSKSAQLDSASTLEHFAKEGFVALENLLPEEHVPELGRYFAAQADQGFLPRLSEHGTRRFVAHNHPVAKFWHDQLNSRVAQLAGQPTKPSYCFASLYVGGDLPWHNDRPPCEYTVALLLSCTPLNADGRSPWALKLKGRDGEVHSVHQGVGDALIFRGRELMHSREVLPEGHRSASLLFHFVNADYDGVME